MLIKDFIYAIDCNDPCELWDDQVKKIRKKDFIRIAVFARLTALLLSLQPHCWSVVVLSTLITVVNLVTAFMVA